MSHKAILRNREVVPVDDLLEWATDFEKGGRRVADDTIDGKRVSTIFLGIDHGHFGQSLWFETMIFSSGTMFSSGTSEEYCERYATYQEAEDGHTRACLLLDPKYVPAPRKPNTDPRVKDAAEYYHGVIDAQEEKK